MISLYEPEHRQLPYLVGGYDVAFDFWRDHTEPDAVVTHGGHSGKASEVIVRQLVDGGYDPNRAAMVSVSALGSIVYRESNARLEAMIEARSLNNG